MRYMIILTLLITPLRLLAGVSPWMDLTLRNGHIFLPTQIEGVKSLALLDTGSQLNAINTTFISKNNLHLVANGRINIKGTLKSKLATTYNNVRVNLFSSSFKLNSIPELNLGYDYCGILLGAPFFDSFVVQINYPEKKIRLVTRDSININKAANIQSKNNLGNGTIAKVEINGKPFWFTIDTGNNSTIVMARRYASRAGLLKYIKGSVMAAGVNGYGKQDIANAKTVQFGPFQISDVKIYFPAAGETSNLASQHSQIGSRIKGERVAGILGYGILKNFLMTIDYKTGKINVALPKKSQ